MEAKNESKKTKSVKSCLEKQLSLNTSRLNWAVAITVPVSAFVEPLLVFCILLLGILEKGFHEEIFFLGREVWHSSLMFLYSVLAILIEWMAYFVTHSLAWILQISYFAFRNFELVWIIIL